MKIDIGYSRNEKKKKKTFIRRLVERNKIVENKQTDAISIYIKKNKSRQKYWLNSMLLVDIQK